MSSKSSIFPSFFVLLLLLCTTVLASKDFAGFTPKAVGNKNGGITFVRTVKYNPKPGQSRREAITDKAKTLLNELHGSLKGDKPGALSILHPHPWSRTLYVATSAKTAKNLKLGGGHDVLPIHPDVKTAVEECGGAAKHKNKGQCAEINANALYYQTNKRLPNKGKLIVAVWKPTEKKGKNGVAKVIPPCDPRETGKFGCKQVLEKMKYNPGEIISSEKHQSSNSGKCTQRTSGGKLGKRACAKKPATIRSATQSPKTATVRKTPPNVKPQNARPAQRAKAPMNAKSSQKPKQIQHKTPKKSTR